MYIAMNRFKVMKGAESAFENVWLSRDTHLDRVPGFLEFHLLRGPKRDDHVLCTPTDGARPWYSASAKSPGGQAPNKTATESLTPESMSATGKT
jgi:hypothetical protein